MIVFLRIIIIRLVFIIRIRLLRIIRFRRRIRILLPLHDAEYFF